jgi:hypothetical protein
MAKASRTTPKTQKRRGSPDEFRLECYRFVGVGDDVLGSAGVLSADSARQGRVRKRAA